MTRISEIDTNPRFGAAMLGAAMAISICMAGTIAQAQSTTPTPPASTNQSSPQTPAADPGAPKHIIQDGKQAQTPGPAQAPIVKAEETVPLKSDLKGTTVISVDDKISGQVEEVVEHKGTKLAVVGFGGFLGFGKTKVAIPVTELAMVSDGVVVVPMTDEQVKNLPEYEG